MSRLDLSLRDATAQIDALLREHPDLAEDEGLRADMIEGATSAGDVLETLYRMIREREASAEAKKALAKTYRDRAAYDAALADRFRDMARALLERAGVEKWSCGIGGFSLVTAQPAVEFYDGEAVPDAFMRVVKEPNKYEIRKALLAGTAVPGARLSNGTPTVRLT